MNLLHLTRVSANVSSDTSRFMEALLLGKTMGGKRLTEADGIGRVFGRLTVVGWAHKDKRGHQLWKCLCSCGNYITVEMQPLNIGRTKSCGCYKVETAGKQSITHGAAIKGADKDLNRTFKIWVGMRKRCGNKNAHAYAEYGERGIAVAPEWDFFESFLKDMGVAPAKSSIERIDNNLGYSKDNCEWLPLSLQNSNKRSTIRIQYAGKEWCLMRLCEHLGLAYPRTYKRYISRGWSLAASLDITTPDSQYETVFYKQKDSL